MFSISSDSCAQSAIAITPADSNLTHPVRCLYIGGDGNIKVITARNHTVTFTNVKGGTILPVSVIRVFATDTTATGIIGLA